MLKKSKGLVVMALFAAGCATTPTASTPEGDEALVPNWETHARDAEIMKSGPAPASATAATNAPTSAMDEMALEAQQFATINYDNLGKDLKAGKGKNVTELFRILKIQQKDQATALRRVKSLHDGSTSAAQFSQDLWNWYQNKN
ncbi:hypothetical protein ACES2J_05605 [Bdellovibrio bacteriovorus]|uniref:hypothetical protein n=1 Tax=Bdellovibrio bacteriovorus TaxID=959 RepID=UPI0035A69270